MAATPQERLALGVAALLLAAGAAARAFSPGPPPAELTGPAGAETSVSRLAADVAKSVEKEELRNKPLGPGEKIDINTAGVDELMRLHGVGEKTAQRIVDWRQSHGPFRSVEELRNVPDVGPAKMERARPYLIASAQRGVVSSRPSFQSAASVADWDRSPGKASRAASAPAGGVVDLNSASVAQLVTLPGIGEALARRIVAWRETHGRFSSVDALRDVSGIGEARLERLRPLVRATP